MVQDESHRTEPDEILTLATGTSCSLWWQNTPQLVGERVGCIGNYAAANDASASVLLSAACARLAARRCTLAVGPLDGSTWRRYRAVTERGARRPFFLEPDTPPDWPEHFEEAGFFMLASYCSALNDNLHRRDPRAVHIAARMAAQQVTIRPLRPTDLDGDLRRIHSISIAAFARNLLYAPLGLEDFAALYRPLLPLIQPELVLLAERAAQPVGFVFALPDYCQAQRGEQIDTLVIKTLAVLPERAYAGLGMLLVERCQAAAQRAGYRRAIHALMHDKNLSGNISAFYAQPFRRYALFAKRLGTSQ
jgi:GNAT superfamily N-acetyltransferase